MRQIPNRDKMLVRNPHLAAALGGPFEASETRESAKKRKAKKRREPLPDGTSGMEFSARKLSRDERPFLESCLKPEKRKRRR